MKKLKARFKIYILINFAWNNNITDLYLYPLIYFFLYINGYTIIQMKKWKKCNVWFKKMYTTYSLGRYIYLAIIILGSVNSLTNNIAFIKYYNYIGV